MTVEIKELVIRAVTTDQPKTANGAASSGFIHEDRDEVVRECVQRVLRILKQSKER